MNHNIIVKGCITGLIILLTSISFSPIIIGKTTIDVNENELTFLSQLDEIKQAPVTCYASTAQNQFFKHQQNLSKDKIIKLFLKLSELNSLISQQSSNNNISRLQTEIIELAKNYSLLPRNYQLPRLSFISRPQTRYQKTLPAKKLEPLDFRRSQFVCNFISIGSGTTGPLFVFPRLVPILLFPIPRLFFMWSAEEGFTSCGGLIRMLGFIATGKQQGIALGFWGVGFSVFLPPVMAYGVVGYTLFVSVTAEDFIGYPFPLLFYLLWYLYSR